MSIRPATAEDYKALCATPLSVSFRGFTLLLDGEPVGISGILMKEDRGVLFGEAKPELRQYPYAIYKGVRKVMELVNNWHVPVVAIADYRVPRSNELLSHLGFTHVDTCQYGEVYEWKPE